MASHFQAAVDTSSPHTARFIPSPAVASSGIPSPPHTPLTLRITADPLLKGYTNVTVKWELVVNGTPQQKGTLPLLIPASRHPTLLHLPAHLPTGSEDARLRLDYHSPRPSSPLIATEWLLLKPYSTDDLIPAAGDLSFNDSNDVFTIHSPKAFLQFDKESGIMLRFEADHHLLSDSGGLTPAFRIDSPTSPRPTTAWDSAQPRLQLFSTSTGTQLVIVRAEYTIPEVSSLLHLSYTINAAGSCWSNNPWNPTPRDKRLHRLPPGLE
jgi:hypothetical protein